MILLFPSIGRWTSTTKKIKGVFEGCSAEIGFMKFSLSGDEWRLTSQLGPAVNNWQTKLSSRLITLVSQETLQVPFPFYSPSRKERGATDLT